MAIDDNTSYELTGAQVKDLANKIKAKAADNIFVGATSAAPGSKGLVPQPQAGDDTKFLSGDGLWKTVSQYSLPIASSTTLGGIKVGNNLTIDPVTGVLDADGSTYTAGNGINIDANDEISVDTSVVAEVSDLPTKTSDLTNDGSDGTSTYVEADDLATVATSGSYNDLTDTPTIPTVNDATLTMQKNGTSVGTFTANASSNETINITVPTTAADVSALPDTTKYGASILMSIDNTTYQVTTTLKDQDGNTLGTAQTIDLPLESVVVSGAYDSQTKEVVLTLVNGSTIRFSVADLVSGLQTEITVSNKLSADLVDDTNTTNKFVTAANKTTWNGKQDALTAGNNIQINGTTISATDTTYSNFVGATSSVAGSAGLVPAPTTSDPSKFLKGDGTWGTALTDKRLLRELVPDGTAIPANSDLKTIAYLRVGKYVCSSSATTATLLNCPVSVAFRMEVFSPLSDTIDNETTSGWIYRVRKLMTFAGEEWMQYANSGSTAGDFFWSPWFKVSTSNIRMTNTDPGTGSSLATGNFVAVYGNSDGLITASDIDMSTISRIMIQGTAGDTTYSSNTEISLASTTVQLGTGLTRSGAKVTVGSGISYVRVSANVFMNYTSINYGWFDIMKNSAAYNNCAAITNLVSSGFGSASVGGILMPVTSGDTIWLRNKDACKIRGYNSWLTVEQVG